MAGGRCEAARGGEAAAMGAPRPHRREQVRMLLRRMTERRWPTRLAQPARKVGDLRVLLLDHLRELALALRNPRLRGRNRIRARPSRDRPVLR